VLLVFVRYYLNLANKNNNIYINVTDIRKIIVCSFFLVFARFLLVFARFDLLTFLSIKKYRNKFIFFYFGLLP